MSTPYTLMRCRMKDLISCFNACKLPIEEDRDESDCDRKPPPEKGPGHQRGGTTPEKGGGEESPASWQSCESEEDEYIVFYFKDDAGAHVIEERGADSSSSRSAVRKKDAGAGDGDAIRRKKHEMSTFQGDMKLIPPKTKEVNETEESVTRGHKKTSGESSDSSTSSFAFPIIQGEWTGSPVLMPRPEGHKSRSVCIQCCKF